MFLLKACRKLSLIPSRQRRTARKHRCRKGPALDSPFRLNNHRPDDRARSSLREQTASPVEQPSLAPAHNNDGMRLQSLLDGFCTVPAVDYLDARGNADALGDRGQTTANVSAVDGWLPKDQADKAPQQARESEAKHADCCRVRRLSATLDQRVRNVRKQHCYSECRLIFTADIRLRRGWYANYIAPSTIERNHKQVINKPSTISKGSGSLCSGVLESRRAAPIAVS